jgi:hypothetical protein
VFYQGGKMRQEDWEVMIFTLLASGIALIAELAVIF